MKKLLLFPLFLFSLTFISQAQWQPDARLTNDPGLSATTAYSNAHCIASSGDTVHVVWRDNRFGGNYEIMYKRSTDGGLTWGADTRLSNNVYFSTNPSISISGSVVIVVWDDDRDGNTNKEIYYNRSTDAGTSWGTDTRLTNDPAASEGPCVSVSGALVFVTWADRRSITTYGGYYVRSTDGGKNWEAETPVKVDSTSFPAVSVSGQVVHMVLQDGRQDHRGITYLHSTDGGTTWGKDIRLTEYTASSNLYSDSYSLSGSGSDVHIAFRDTRNSTGTAYEIFHKHSTDGGLTWSSDTQLSNAGVTVYNPSVSVSGSGVHVVWAESHDGNADIYYNRSLDGGISWETATRLTNNSSVSFYPSVSASVSAAHVIWQDNRDGNYEIYYKRNLTGNPVGLEKLQKSDLQFTAFPNPASTEIKIRSLEKFNELTIYDIYGKETYQSGALNPTPEIVVSTVDFPAGIYFIRLKNGKRISIQKFIKL